LASELFAFRLDYTHLYATGAGRLQNEK